MRAFGCGFAISLLLGAMGAALAKEHSCDDPILIGTTISKTGPLASLTYGFDKVTEAFEKEVNGDGGILLNSCGKRVPIKFVVYDDQGNPATAVSLHEKMATVDNVDVFAGVDWSFVAGPVSNIAERYKIPLVGGNVATPSLFERGLKYFWATPYPVADQWDADISDMLEHVDPKPKTIFWITQDNPVFKAVQATWSKRHDENGIKTLGNELFPSDLKDFSSVVLKVRAANPDLIYINSFDTVALPLVQKLRQMKVKAMDVHFPLATIALHDQTKSFGGLEGVTAHTSWMPGMRGVYTDLIQRVFDTAKIDLSASTTNMPRFTSYLVIVQAIERAGVIDREKIREALFKGTFKGPNGDITFGDNGAPNTRTLVTQVQDGKFKVVWPPELATGQLKWPVPSWQ